MKPLDIGDSFRKFGPVVFGAGLGVGVTLFVWAALLQPSDSHYTFAMLAAAIAGLAAAGLLVRRVVLPTWLRGLLGSPAGLAAASVCIFVFIDHCGMRQFGGFDHSALIDAGWRMAQGQRPYFDFPCTLPIGFLLGTEYAFGLFGVHWQSLILFHGCYAVILFVWSYVLLTRILADRSVAFLLAFACQAVSMMVVSYWWYNPITSATAVVFLLSAILALQRPRFVWAWASYIVSLALLAAMKPNVGGLVIAGATVVLLTCRAARWRAIGASLAAGALLLGWLALHHIRVVDVYAGYRSIAGRGFSMRQFLQDLSPTEQRLSLVGLGLVILPAAFSIWRVLRNPALGRTRGLALVALIAGLYGFLTNGELKLVDVPLLLLASAVFVLDGLPSELRPALVLTAGWGRYIKVLAFVLITLGLAQGITRHRVEAIGPGAFFEYQLVPEPIHNPFFRNLRTGGIFRSVLGQVGEVVGRHPGAQVYFGPRLQWGYAAFGLSSPVGQPIWWHPGVSLESRDVELYLDRWTVAKFDLLVFWYNGHNNDFTYMPQAFLDRIAMAYREDDSLPALTLYFRREP